MTGTCALIHLDNLKHNINLVRSLVGDKRKICFPVKADAYGHGMVPLARAAMEWGCDYLSVARTGEIRELRVAGIKAPVMVMSHVHETELDELVRLKAEPFVGSLPYLKAVEEAVAKNASPLNIHLKVDTGMGRIGSEPSEVLGLAEEILNSPLLTLKGLCTHFPVSDETDIESVEFTRAQIEDLKNMAEEIRRLPKAVGCEDFLVHGANSGGTAQHGESYLDMVRPGILLYGYEPIPTVPIGVRPLMELSSEINFIKKIQPGQSVSYGRTWTAREITWIGTAPVGYGDGYSRLLSNKGQVWTDGESYPLRGRVCMDQIMFDLGKDCKAALEDRITLFGPPPCPFSAADIARQMGTISYEVCCLITKRVPRFYKKEKEIWTIS